MMRIYVSIAPKTSSSARPGMTFTEVMVVMVAMVIVATAPMLGGRSTTPRPSAWCCPPTRVTSTEVATKPLNHIDRRFSALSDGYHGDRRVHANSAFGLTHGERA